MINKILSYLPHLLSAILILIVGHFIVKWISKVIVKAFEKINLDPTLEKFLQRLIYFGLIFLVIASAINALGINTASFAAMIGAIGVTIGLALQKNFANIGAGIVILILRPFKVGDYVEIGGVEGRVNLIGVFQTHILTNENNLTILPNSNIISTKIINYSKTKSKKISLQIKAQSIKDIDSLKQNILNVISTNPNILKSPPPSILTTSISPTTISFTASFWVKENPSYIKSLILEEFKNKLSDLEIA